MRGYNISIKRKCARHRTLEYDRTTRGKARHVELEHKGHTTLWCPVI
ncbi:unnamed protein product [Rhodiola kirilowii]